MSFLTRLSLANRGLVALIAVVITAFGIYTVPTLKQQLLPSLEFPGAFIGVVVPGASPEIMEEQVTKPIEDAIKGADGLDTIQSTTSEGSATIQVLFETLDLLPAPHIPQLHCVVITGGGQRPPVGRERN